MVIDQRTMSPGWQRQTGDIRTLIQQGDRTTNSQWTRRPVTQWSPAKSPKCWESTEHHRWVIGIISTSLQYNVHVTCTWADFCEVEDTVVVSAWNHWTFLRDRSVSTLLRMRPLDVLNETMRKCKFENRCMVLTFLSVKPVNPIKVCKPRTTE